MKPPTLTASTHGWELRRWRWVDCALGAWWMSRRGKVAHVRVALRRARVA